MGKEEITSIDEFEKAIKQGVTLVDFHAPWCAPCRSQEPIIDHLSNTFKGKVLIAAMDIDGQQALAENLGIQGIPTLILYKDKEEIQRFVGLQEEYTLIEALDKALV